MIHLYDTSNAEEKALAYFAAKRPSDQTETADQAFQRITRQALRGLVDAWRAAKDQERAAAYDTASASVKASVDAALNVS